jgi:hypothetical protein
MKRIITIACISLTFIKLSYANTDINDCFDFDKDEHTIVGFSCVAEDLNFSIVIPGEIDGVIVKKIGRRAFADEKLKNVSFPSSMKIIRDGAFVNNELTRVVIPEGVTYIAKYAFADNNITSVVIPCGMNVLHSRAFHNNELRTIPISLKCNGN